MTDWKQLRRTYKNQITTNIRSFSYNFIEQRLELTTDDEYNSEVEVYQPVTIIKMNNLNVMTGLIFQVYPEFAFTPEIALTVALQYNGTSYIAIFSPRYIDR